MATCQAITHICNIGCNTHTHKPAIALDNNHLSHVACVYQDVIYGLAIVDSMLALHGLRYDKKLVAAFM